MAKINHEKLNVMTKMINSENPIKKKKKKKPFVGKSKRIWIDLEGLRGYNSFPR